MSYNRSDIRLSFNKDNVRFFTNKKKGIVTCVIEADLLTPQDYDTHLYGVSFRRFTGFGMAKCSNDDVFDVERGKRIALAKAENNAYDKAGAYLLEYIKEMDAIRGYIMTFMDKAERHGQHNLDYIDSIHNPEHPLYKKTITNIKVGTTDNKPNNE